jgi:hypothetical protein
MCDVDDSQALKLREPVRKPTRPYPVVLVQLPENLYRSLSAMREAGLSSIERYRGRAIVVVVGITSHRGARNTAYRAKGGR